MFWPTSLRTYTNGPNNKKTVLLANYTKDELSTAKKMIWKASYTKLDRFVQRVDTSVRGAECANSDDILNAMQKLIAMNDMPHIVLDAKDIARLPKYFPAELLEPSLAERMAVVESQLQQLNDNASSIMYEQKVDRLEKRDKKPLADNQDNRAPCGSVCSTVRSTQAWRNVPLTVRLPTDSKSHITHANGVTSTANIVATNSATSATTNGVTNDATSAGTSDITIDDNNDDYGGDTLDELSTRPEADGQFETPRYLRNKRSKRITNCV